MNLRNYMIKNVFQSLSIAIIFTVNWCFSSPFLIDFPDKTELTNADYVDIQNKMRGIDFSSLIETYYPNNGNFSEKKYFERRMRVGIGAVLIDEEKELLPQVIFEKIGNGGNCCVVSYASYNRKYPELLKDILAALTSTGFNGYFYARIGGYPNPTGREAKYAATPYGFKIPMIIEAFQKGFENVLYLDSACLPMEDCTPVFKLIHDNGCFFVGGRNCYENGWVSYFFPKAKAALMNIYRRNPLLEKQISGSIIGFKKDDARTQRFLQEYYRILELGEPFMSELSEMFVFASIAGHLDFPKHFYIDPYSKQLPSPVYAYTEEDHPELSAEQRKGTFLYRQFQKDLSN